MNTTSTNKNQNLTTEEMVAYLKGELSPEEMDRVDSILIDDPLAAEAMEELEDFLKKGGDAVGKTTRHREIFRDDLKRLGGQGQTTNRNTTFQLVSIAAMLALIMVPAYLLLRPTPEKLFAKHFQPYEDIYNVRAGNSDLPEVLISALDDYNNKSYDAAIGGFEQLSENERYGVMSRFYTAQCYIALSKPTEALAILNDLSENKSLIIQDNIKWYSALAYLKAGDKENAKDLFTRIAADPSHYKNDAAKKILVRL